MPMSADPGDVADGDADAGGDLRAEGDRGEGAEQRRRATAARRARRRATERLGARRAEQADDETDHADDDHADDERPDARVDAGQRRVADRRRRPGWAGAGRGPTPTTMPTTTAIANAPTIRRAEMPSADEDAGQRDRDERQDAVEDAPAHRAEDPLPEEQRGPDDDAGRRPTMTRTIATRDRAPATCATSPPIAVASALARSTWAMTSRIAASRVASIWARRPGGGAGSRRRWAGRRRRSGRGPGGGAGGGPWAAGRAGVGRPGGIGGPGRRCRGLRVVQGGAPSAERIDAGVGPMIPAGRVRRTTRTRDPGPVRYAPPMARRPGRGGRLLTAELLSIGTRADGRRDPRHERRASWPAR